MTDPHSLPGRIAGIDFGTVRIGIALSDARQSIASPYENYTRRGTAADAQRFARLVQEEEIRLFVVGLPLHGDGRESQKSQEARRFGAWLAAQTGVPVEFFDERYTSVEAEQ
ncbi:MAG: Holliday junction resolvase RuvX, partial [Planctomycetaceae bacterium]|nr:Holliday junction resolvase RuvX [Planctomycetaceae bacterium]